MLLNSKMRAAARPPFFFWYSEKAIWYVEKAIALSDNGLYDTIEVYSIQERGNEYGETT